MGDFLNTGAPSLSIGAIAINPNNPQEIYAGTGEANGSEDAILGAGIYHSSDGGQTWGLEASTDLSSIGIYNIAINSVTPVPDVLAATTSGLWKLNNDHLTWSRVSIPTPHGVPITVPVTDVVYVPNISPTVAYAGVQVAFTKDSSGAVVSSPIIRSTDGGLSWSPVDLSAAGLASNPQLVINRVGLGVSQGGTAVYAALVDTTNQANLLNGNIYLSLDSGGTWQAAPVPDGLLGVPDMKGDSSGHQWDYNLTVAVDPTNASKVLVGGVDLWYSPDSGGRWTNLTNVYSGGTVHGDNHALAFVPSSSTLYDGNDGGVWLGSPCQLPCDYTFADLNGGGLNLTQFYGGSVGAGSTPTLAGGTQDNGTSLYPPEPVTTGAATWTQRYAGDGGDVAVDFTNNSIIYAESPFGSMAQSTDGGSNWTVVGGGATSQPPLPHGGTHGLNACDVTTNPPGGTCDNTNFVMPFVMSPSNHNELLAGTDRVYRSTDGATSWSVVGGPFDTTTVNCPQGLTICNVPISAVAVAPSNDNDLYVGLNDGSVLTYIQGGWSGTSLVPLNTGWVTGVAADPTNPQVAYATVNGYSGHHVFKTINGGLNWTDVGASLPNVPFMSVAVNPEIPSQVLAGSDAGIYISPDGGTTWSRFGSGMPDVAVDQIFTNPTGTDLFVATHGRGMWTIPLVSGTVYFPDNVGAGAVDAHTGTPKWYHDWTTYGCPSTCFDQMVLVNAVLYATGDVTPGAVTAIRDGDGSVLWKYVDSISGTVSASAVANGIVYFGDAVNHLLAVNANTGALVWNKRLSTTKNVVAETPTVANGIVYVGSSDKHLYAVNASTGAITWSYAFGSQISGPPAIANGIVFVGSTDHYLYALNASTGALVWRYATLGQIYSSPAVANGIVYVGSTDDYLYALNATTGALVWNYHATGGAPAVPTIAQGTVYFTAGVVLYALDAATGFYSWSYEDHPSQPGNWSFAVAAANGVVYGGTQYGTYALNGATGAVIGVYDACTSNCLAGGTGSPVVGP
jgi:outer membrane protein assembly factor BamB